MKVIKLILPALLLTNQVAISEEIATPTSEKEQISYSLGVSAGHNFRTQESDIDLDMFMQGIKDSINDHTLKLSDKAINDSLGKFQYQNEIKRQERLAKQNKDNLKAGKDFLAKNKKADNVVTTKSGLQYKVLTKVEQGESPALSDTVVVNYEGRLLNGDVFDSSYKRNQPIKFPLNNLIKGWQEALQLMKPGEKWQLYVPAELAYGETGAPPMIGPNATLIFDVELIEVKKTKKVG